MTRMTGPDCVVMCNLINTHTHTHLFKADAPGGANEVIRDEVLVDHVQRQREAVERHRRRYVKREHALARGLPRGAFAPVPARRASALPNLYGTPPPPTVAGGEKKSGGVTKRTTPRVYENPARA